ncbi:protein DpdH [Pseudomonas sp. LSJ-87]|uniref:protein DpdH n=1 Tax=Pseudomonas sp. LSJ-87 TaxID=3079932 RepID=UPI0029415062|nr:protein DpdH [Pseudomonas sp. LSJ-87]MDV5100036.1 protein DpdH [Pseudomonas sp. LSJ-87]
MSLINYWPQSEYVTQCIRTEAEELAEHVLLAVHEPMQLLRIGAGVDELCDEQNLLDHFLSIERPLPIIGRSGVGKSHLIRWMDAKLKLHSDYQSWHVVRIPKNASLRQVLELLLAGLEGEEFEQARDRISTVGEQLKTGIVADLLLTFMSQQLKELHQDATQMMEYYREHPEYRAQLSDEEKRRLRDIQTYTLPGRGLSELITDSNFKKNLLNPEHCIYQFASRLTHGATDHELIRNDYQIKDGDLDFSFNLDDLSLSARQCVSTTQLNTNQVAREGAARVLNEVLGESTRTVFGYLFQFNGGSFQDLFKEIRRSLRKQNRTLVVLVEDMAAISAIEDVLIDSLLEESVRDGEQELCTLRSAIAVTDGYQGYLRRQDTIKTRAQYEWHIREQGQDRELTLERIIDFCGRYLNAARYGGEALKSSWLVRESESWPPVWSDSDDGGDDLKAFGYASSGIPLFPFNRNAIEALADNFCRKGDEELKFNPRQVLNEILLRTLSDYRGTCLSNAFPPADFAGIKVNARLLGTLQKLENPERCKTLAAIWGYGCRSVEDLQSKIDRRIAKVFGLDGLVTILKDGIVAPSQGAVEPYSPSKIVGKSDVSVVADLDVDPDNEALHQLEEAVTLWFQGKQKLGQYESADIRKSLEQMYQLYARSEWIGIAVRPALKNRLIPIELPNAMGNLAGWTIKFCTQKDFESPGVSDFLQGVALAFLRYEYFNRKSSSVGWQYRGGFDDYLLYQSFAARWVPDVLQALAIEARQALPNLIGKQLQSAMTLGLLADSNNDRERLNELLRTAEEVRAVEVPAVVPELKQARDQAFDGWDAQREAWLKLVSANDHGMDGDSALNAFKVAKGNQDAQLSKLWGIISQALRFSVNIVEVLEGCTRQDVFCSLLDEMADLVRDISVGGQHYPVQSDFPSSKKMRASLVALKDSESWRVVKDLLALREETDVVKRLQRVNKLDGQRLEQVVKALTDWSKFYNYVLPRLESENNKWGGDILKQSQDSVTRLLEDMAKTVTELREESHDCA